MPIGVPFIRNLEGNMRLRTNNKPVPDYAKGFKNPVPKPPKSGGGILTKFLKFGGKLAAIPVYLLIDFFGNQKGFSSGDIPDWLKQEGSFEEIQQSIIPFTGGQMNIQYFVDIEVRHLNPNGPGYSRDGVITKLAYGPIKGIEYDKNIRNCGYGTGQGSFITTPTYCETFVHLAARIPSLQNISNLNYENPGNPPGQNVTRIISVRPRYGEQDTGGNPPPTTESIKSDSTTDASKAIIDGINNSTYKIRSVLDPILFPEKFGYVANATPRPTISPKPAVIPTEIPQPIPDPKPEFEIFPDPEPVFVPTPIPKIIPELIIIPDPQPDFNPPPRPTEPTKKWRKITTYVPNHPSLIGSGTKEKTNTKPPIVLDKTPTPLPNPEPVKPLPPIQTPVDKCADHCGSGTIDFNLPDDSELAELLKAIKKKVDEIEQSVNQTLDGSIEVGSCEIPKDTNNETDELIYTPDPAKTITYSDKGLKAINLALSGVQTKLTSLHEEFCQPKDIPNGIPEWWQVRAGSDRPQLVVIFKGGDSYWSMALPWYKGKFKEKIINLIPGYDRGNFSTVLTLNDNSKIVVNASSKEEGERFIKRIQAVIKPKLLEQAELKSGGERKGKPLKTGKVIPVYAKYFSTGQQDLLPDWRYNFKTQKFIKYAKPDTQ